MGKRIIVTNGDLTTNHEIGDSAIVIGRDPDCDLFFVNQRLSRRHARVEPGPDGVRLVDLGSRNGMWVNEEKVGEHLLRSGDAIRLGGLRIVFEEDNAPSEAEPESPEGEEATIILPAHEADKTVVQRSGEPAQDEAGESHADATVVLADGAPTADRTVMLAPDLPGSPDVNDGSQTVVLAKEPAEPEESSATVVLSGGGKTDAGEGGRDETQYLPGHAAAVSPGEEEPLLVLEPERLASSVQRRLAEARGAAKAFVSRTAEQFALLTWETKFILVLSGVGLVVTFILAIIARRTSSALVGVLAGLPLIVGWSYTAVVLARRLTVRPVAELTRDLKGFGRGEKPALLSRREYPELDRLSKGIGRLVGLAQSSAVSTDSGVSDPGDSDSGANPPQVRRPLRDTSRLRIGSGLWSNSL